MTMTRLMRQMGRAAAPCTAAFAFAAMLVPAPASAGTPACGTAILRDVEVVVARMPQPTITSVQTRRKDPGRPGDRVVHVYATPAERQTKRYLVTVRLGDMVYTGESPGDDFWNFDPTRLVINDPIEACVADGRLRLRRPDGKHYKTRIVRAERAAPLP